MVVSNSLKIIEFGQVEALRPWFHGKNYIYPIGYKALRDYPSIFDLNQKLHYLCEILDGSFEALFSVTPYRERGDEDTCPESGTDKLLYESCGLVRCGDAIVEKKPSQCWAKILERVAKL